MKGVGRSEKECLQVSKVRQEREEVRRSEMEWERLCASAPGETGVMGVMRSEEDCLQAFKVSQGREGVRKSEKR